MRIVALIVLVTLAACAPTAGISLYRRNANGPDEYSVKEFVPGQHPIRPTSLVMGQAHAFCAKRDNKAAVFQEQENPPSGVFVFTCIPRVANAIAQ